MTIRHLRVFLEVATLQSMSRAAQKLHFSQSTVSQVIKELETHYNTLLFERLSKRLYITANGKELMSYAKSIVAQFDALENAMNDAASMEHIHLGMTITCGSCILPILLKQCKKSIPHVDIISTICNTHVIEEKLLMGELDIALVEGKVKSKDLICTPIVDDNLVLAFHVSHEIAKKASFKPEDLHHMDFVVRESGSGTRECFDNYLSKHNVEIRKKVEAPFPEAMKHAIMDNNCLAVMSPRLLVDEIQNGSISTLRIDSNDWDRHFCLVHHKDKFFTASMQCMIELIKTSCEY